MHLSTNLVIDVDEAAGTAVCRSVYVMLQATDSLPLQVIDAGRNTDTFERVDGTWTWKERYINVELHGDLSQHLFADTTPFTCPRRAGNYRSRTTSDCGCAQQMRTLPSAGRSTGSGE